MALPTKTLTFRHGHGTSNGKKSRLAKAPPPEKDRTGSAVPATKRTAQRRAQRKARKATRQNQRGG